MLQNFEHECFGFSILQDTVKIDTDQIGALKHEAYAVVIAEYIGCDFNGSGEFSPCGRIV